MARQHRSISKEFIEYQNYIVHHPNYKTLPNKFNSAGDITWVKVKDKDRTAWWDNLVVEMKLEDRAAVARAIHPNELNGLKPCQVCGKSMDINYAYLREATLGKLISTEKISKLPLIKNALTALENPTIESVLEVLENNDPPLIIEMARVLQVEPLSDIREQLINLKYDKHQMLSPGAMSNAPDRLDGFHTYNLCCRPSQDLGRSKANLARYTQDRRAYENWSDGDWKLANRIMGIYANSLEKVSCPKCGKASKMSADHIGPISLGFCHSSHFKPLCINCNSGKNNRFDYEDFKELRKIEDSGEVVVSWHSSKIWELLKPTIRNDNDCLMASVKMRKHLHQSLLFLADIYLAGHQEFLEQFLHPEYSFFEHTFTSFDVKSGKFEVVSKKNITENTKRNAERYIRISFESLQDYASVENRRIFRWNDPLIDKKLRTIVELLAVKEDKKAKQLLLKAIEDLAEANYRS